MLNIKKKSSHLDLYFIFENSLFSSMVHFLIKLFVSLSFGFLFFVVVVLSSLYTLDTNPLCSWQRFFLFCGLPRHSNEQILCHGFLVSWGPSYQFWSLMSSLLVFNSESSFLCHDFFEIHGIRSYVEVLHPFGTEVFFFS